MGNKDWEKISIGELGELRNGINFSREQEGVGVAVLKVKDFGDQIFCPQHGFDELDSKAVSIPADQMLKANDIVIIRSNGNSALVGRSLIVGRLSKPTTFSGFCIRFRPHTARVDPRFIIYYLKSPACRMRMSQFGSGTGIQNLNQSILASLPIDLPAIKEQHEIALVLGSLDDKIEQNRRTSVALEGLARAIFKAWFVDFEPVKAKAAGAKSFPGMPPEAFAALPNRLVEVSGELIPDGWSKGTLGDLIEIHDSKRIPLSSRQREERQGPYRYYGAAGIVDHVNAFLFDGIYLLLGEDGSVMNDDGHPIVQYVWGQFWVNNHAHVLTGRGKIGVEQLYLLTKEIPVSGFVTGAVQPKISQTNLRRIPVTIAMDVINATFGTVIEPIFAMIRQLADESEKLAELREYLLPKLLSGEVRVRAKT